MVSLKYLDQKIAEKEAQLASPEQGDTLEDVGTFGRSALSGATLGVSEPIISAVQAPFLTGASAFANSREAGEDFFTALKKGVQSATSLEDLTSAIIFDVSERERLKKERLN